MKPRALDLFAGAGGVSYGLELAGFDVTAVDIAPQPRHKGGTFIQADAMTFPLDGFDFIWASPPCQSHSALRTMPNLKRHVSLVAAIRERLAASGALYVIENVVGAPLRNPVTLCGTEFGLGITLQDGKRLHLKRHRQFEANFHIWRRGPCRCSGVPVCGVYGHGGGPPAKGRRGWQCTAADARTALGIDWMNRDELSQAIPPAYSEHIGRQAMDARAARLPVGEERSLTKGLSSR